MCATMPKAKKFKRGQLVQDTNDVIYIYVKRNKLTSHAIKLDNNGMPICMCEIITQDLGPIKNIPEGFTSIQIL